MYVGFGVVRLTSTGFGCVVGYLTAAVVILIAWQTVRRIAIETKARRNAIIREVVIASSEQKLRSSSARGILSQATSANLLKQMTFGRQGSGFGRLQPAASYAESLVADAEESAVAGASNDPPLPRAGERKPKVRVTPEVPEW